MSRGRLHSFLTSVLDEGGQHYAPATLPPEDTLVLIGWVPESVGRFRVQKTLLALAGIVTQDCPARSLVCVQTTPSRLRVKIVIYSNEWW